MYQPKIVALGATRCADVLPPAARRLHHLVMGSRAIADEPVAEGDRSVVDDFGHLKRLQAAVAAAGAECGWAFVHGVPLRQFQLIG